MACDDLKRAREDAERAVRVHARYPSSTNATKAQVALRTLQKNARNAGAQRRRTQLADRIRQITRL